MTSPRRCERTRRHLPELVTDDLSRARRWRVQRHLDRCVDCAEALVEERRLVDDLNRLADDDPPPVAPPDDLLGRLLADVDDPGIRARIAVPARGAVSGARPGLTAALVLAVLAVAVGAGWAGWRLGRAWRDRD